MDKCRGCEAFPKCTAKNYGDVTCRYLRFSYGMDDRTEMTNADRIRAMSDDELAQMLKRQGCPSPECSCYDKTCNKCWLEWLKQPAGEE